MQPMCCRVVAATRLHANTGEIKIGSSGTQINADNTVISYSQRTQKNHSYLVFSFIAYFAGGV
jgi:hypothetical protein